MPYTDEYTLSDISNELLAGRLQLWAVVEEEKPVATFTTAVVEFPRKKVLECIHLGGERLDEWASTALKVLDVYAAQEGCTEVVTIGRKATEKLYKKLGFEFDSVKMVRKI